METDEPRSQNRQGTPVALVVAGVLVAAAIFFSATRATPTEQASPSGSPASSVAIEEGTETKVDVAVTDSDPVLGQDSAPITVIEFSDFECPYCRQFHAETFPELKKTYIDTGRIQYVYKDFPLSQIHPQAQLAAEAAHCAQAQDKFWEYADKLFSPEASLAEADLKQYATELELQLTEFATCLTKHQQAELITTNAQTAIAAGITGTPAFVINGTLLEGALPLEVFTKVLEAAVTPQP